MSDVSLLLDAVGAADPCEAAELLRLVYDDLRRLAGRRLAHEAPGQTLQPTALVHEAYLRLVASRDASAPRQAHWDNRGHFFAAAAEAMRRILVEIHASAVAAALETALSARVLDEDAAHGLGRRREEMAAIVPARFRLSGLTSGAWH